METDRRLTSTAKSEYIELLCRPSSSDTPAQSSSIHPATFSAAVSDDSPSCLATNTWSLQQTCHSGVPDKGSKVHGCAAKKSALRPCVLIEMPIKVGSGKREAEAGDAADQQVPAQLAGRARGRGRGSRGSRRRSAPGARHSLTVAAEIVHMRVQLSADSPFGAQGFSM